MRVINCTLRTTSPRCAQSDFVISYCDTLSWHLFRNISLLCFRIPSELRFLCPTRSFQVHIFGCRRRLGLHLHDHLFVDGISLRRRGRLLCDLFDQSKSNNHQGLRLSTHLPRIPTFGTSQRELITFWSAILGWLPNPDTCNPNWGQASSFELAIEQD